MPRLPTPEEIARFKWNHVQQKAMKSANEFLLKNVNEEDDDMDEDDCNGDIEGKEYEFFRKMFNEVEDLKGFYVKYSGSGGEFSCLVCGGANEKCGKRFKDCVALVRHSVSVVKTKSRSHRAYGQVICKVLGWDIDHLPSFIVSDLKSNELQGDDADGNKDSKAGTSDGGSNKTLDNGDSNLKEDSSASEKAPVGCDPIACEGLNGDYDEDLHGGTGGGCLNKIANNVDLRPSEFQPEKAPDGSNPVAEESMVCEETNGDGEKDLNLGTGDEVLIKYTDNVDSNVFEIQRDKAPGVSTLVDGDSRIFENSVAVASVDIEDSGKLVLYEAKANAEAVIENVGNDGYGDKDSKVGMNNADLNVCVDIGEGKLAVNSDSSEKVPGISNLVGGESVVCEGNDGDGRKDLNKNIDNASEIPHDKALDISNPVGGESMVCDNASAIACTEVQDTRKQVSDDVQGHERGVVVDNLVPQLQSKKEKSCATPAEVSSSQTTPSFASAICGTPPVVSMTQSPVVMCKRSRNGKVVYLKSSQKPRI